MIGRVRTGCRGFTLVELAVVVVIIGVLAAFGVPRILRSSEQAKTSEAFAYLAAVRSAQESFRTREGAYAETLANLVIQAPTPRYFSIGTLEAGPTGEAKEPGWSLTLARVGASAGYGVYTVTYNARGYDPSRSTIPPAIDPTGGRSRGEGQP